MKKQYLQRKIKLLLQFNVDYMSNEQSAQELLKTIPEEYGAFIVQEDGKFKVIAGIFMYEEAEKKSNELSIR